MYKKLLSVVLCIIIIVSISSCGKNNNDEKDAEISRLQEMVDSLSSTSDTDVSSSEAVTTSSVTSEKEISTATTSKAADDTTSSVSFESILLEINDDFDTVISNMENKLNNVYSTIGDSYEGYVANESTLDDWYNELYEESEKLFKRTVDRNIDYLNLIAESSERSDYDFTDDKLDQLYDSVYSGACDTYYEKIYSGLLDDVYEKYYSGILDKAYDGVDYSEWYATSSRCYKSWYNSSSDIYKLWYKNSSILYKYWYKASSNFLYKDNFDVNAIIQEITQDIKEETDGSSSNDETETTTTATTESKPVETTKEDNSSLLDNVIRPEFKEAMDSYEAYFTKYCEFMKKYQANPTDLSLLTEYMDFMQSYTETMKKMEDLGKEEMSNAETIYYAEVVNRINKMLLNVIS